MIPRDCCADADADAAGAAAAAAVDADARALERIGCGIGFGNVFEEVGVPSLDLCLGLWLRWDLCSGCSGLSRFLDQRHWVWEMEMERQD